MPAAAFAADICIGDYTLITIFVNKPNVIGVARDVGKRESLASANHVITKLVFSPFVFANRRHVELVQLPVGIVRNGYVAGKYRSGCKNRG